MDDLFYLCIKQVTYHELLGVKGELGAHLWERKVAEDRKAFWRKSKQSKARPKLRHARVAFFNNAMMGGPRTITVLFGIHFEILTATAMGIEGVDELESSLRKRWRKQYDEDPTKEATKKRIMEYYGISPIDEWGRYIDEHEMGFAIAIGECIAFHYGNG